MSPDQLAVLGAFLSGIGSVLGAIFWLRRLRERMERECEKRIELFREGIKIGKGDAGDDRDPADRDNVNL